MCCFLAPEKMRAIGADAVDRSDGPFVYVVELRFNPAEMALHNPDYEFVSLPPSVERAVKERRAAVLCSYAGEGSRQFQVGRLGRTPRLRSLLLHSPFKHQVTNSLYDCLATFAKRYELLPEQLWYVSAAMGVEDEAESWRSARQLKSLPFTVRSCEIASFGTGLVMRESLRTGRGPIMSSLVTNDDRGHYLPWHRSRVTWGPNPFGAYLPGDRWEEPRWRFASLNKTFRVHRWWTVERLFRAGVLEYGCVSFPQLTDERLEEIGYTTVPEDLRPLVATLPRHIDYSWTEGGAKSNTQGFLAEVTPAVITVPPQVAKASACQVVTETYYDQTPAFDRMVTEKSFKALLGRGPAVIVGSHGSLQYLRDIGASTWCDVIDEEYDLVPDWNPDTGQPARLDAALDSILPFISEVAQCRSAAFACRRQQEENLRWLTEAEKPWDSLLRGLASALAGM